MEQTVLSMFDAKSWPPSILSILLLLKEMGFRFTKEENTDPEFEIRSEEYPLKIYWAGKVGEPIPQIYAINKNNSKKEVFLKHFGGGNGPSIVVGAIPWTSRGKSFEADFYADLGSGKNNRIYFDKGWIAYTDGGYSNMSLLEMNCDRDDPENGMVLSYGENAFSKYRLLQTNWSPDSINRWDI